MLSFIGGGVISAGLVLGKKHKRGKVRALWLRDQPPTRIEPRQEEPPDLKTALAARVAAADDRFQHFIQTRIDPLLGKERHAQFQEMLNEAEAPVSEEERAANQFFALSTLTLGVATLGHWVLTPLMPVAIVLGLTATSVNYLYAWQQWKEKRQFGNTHLLCVYVTFMWLGGYAVVGALGIFLAGISLKVRTITENKSRNNLINIFHLQPTKVWVRSNGAEVEIPFAQLQVGDTLVLQAGQIVPVDGTIVAGVATVDQHMLTGEAQPVEKLPHDRVLAATVLISGKIDIRVEKTGTATTAGQIGEILNQSAQYTSATAVKGLAVADRFALPTLALSSVSWPLIGPAGAISLLGANSTINAYFTGPLAVLNFLNLAAADGVLVKDGGALEQLNEVDTIIFDKTGTLTIEQPHVAQLHPFGDMAANELLTLAAAAEARQTHPIARAILDAAAERNLQLPAIDHAHYEAGYGIKVRLMGPGSAAEEPTKWQHGSTAIEDSEEGPHPSPLLLVGSSRFMTIEGIALPEEVDRLTAACHAQGHSLVMVAVDNTLVGAIELQPTIRPEAQRIIDGLHARGLALYIISGDQEAPTRKLAEELGMSGYFANILPEGKADLVEGLQQEGRKVCFIGDGINDAIAMRKAEVSISLRGATTAATDTAQIILMGGNLDQLLQLFKLSEAFTRNLKRNFRFTAGVSILAMSGIFLVGFTFLATELLYTASLLGGLAITMMPLLTTQPEDDEL